MTDLAYVLRHLPHYHDPNLLAGDNPADDAAIYRLRDDLALVQTVDFFTPIVDDPYTYGQIAAANSLSDVYTMGGSPVTALNIVGFPVNDLPLEILSEILRGGAEKAAEAGVPIVGGHTVDDAEPKYGLSVTGTVHPERFLTAQGGRPGDVLVLTKPIGTGVIATALKAGAARPEDMAEAVRWMVTLNRDAAAAMLDAGARASTDITGFGLLGHLVEMGRASGVAATIDSAAVPILPGAFDAARAGFIPNGSRTNLTYIEPNVTFADVDEAMRALLVDPQTSGGLLLALPPENLDTFASHAGAALLSAVIGTLTAGVPGAVLVNGR
jgi:selenide,water dikinase